MTREQRRLAAILSVDVVGYSRLMGRDESGTVARLRALLKQHFEPVLARHKGRVVKLTGDGALVEFASAVEALAAAIEFQQAMARENEGQTADDALVFRIGLHLGDVIVDGDDLYGDGVNVAARLEGEAPPGGIVVSGTLQEFIGGRLKAAFEDLGELSLKNINRPVRAMRVSWQADDWPEVRDVPTAAPSPTWAPPVEGELPLPDKPSIVVLPFINMSGDAEQDYFADGITEDIITELTRFRSLFVIARNSSFSYKGAAVDVRTVARDLGVRYVVEGSVRKSGNRVRVTAQLIDVINISHIWAEKYDRILDDIFLVQEDITHCVVAALGPEIDMAEVAKSRRPQSLTAYETATRANGKFWQSLQIGDYSLMDEALANAREALAIDAASVRALGCAATILWMQSVLGLVVDRQAAWQDGLQLAERLVEADRTSSEGYRQKGQLLIFAPDASRSGDAMANLRHAHKLNPHSTLCLYSLAFGEVCVGESASALSHIQEAWRISPRDYLRPDFFLLCSQAHFCLRNYQAGIDNALRGIDGRPKHGALYSHLAANYVGIGELAKGQRALDDARHHAPGFVERALAGGLRYYNSEHLGRATTFLRIAAGLEDPRAADGLR